jgi:hypothetical protein
MGGTTASALGPRAESEAIPIMLGTTAMVLDPSYPLTKAGFS